MGSDQSSIYKLDAATAFFTSVIDETFGATDAKMGENNYLEATVKAGREEVKVRIDCDVQEPGNDGGYFSYSFYGPDSAVSTIMKKIEPKIQKPSLVRGDHVFGRSGSAQEGDDAGVDDDRLTDADRALLLPAKWFALAFWFVFGFLLWIPILIRSHVFVSMAIALSALSGTRKDNLYRMIRYANSFWVRGFQNISDFGSERHAGDRTDIGSALILLVIEASFAVAFYALIILGIRQL